MNPNEISQAKEIIRVEQMNARQASVKFQKSIERIEEILVQAETQLKVIATVMPGAKPLDSELILVKSALSSVCHLKAEWSQLQEKQKKVEELRARLDGNINN